MGFAAGLLRIVLKINKKITFLYTFLREPGSVSFFGFVC